MDTIEQTIKDFILESYLLGADPSQLTADTPLITGGILDSLATVQLSLFLEEHFRIEIAPHETATEHLNTIGLIGQLVRSKLPS